jgi:hypothetical protein
MRAALKIDLENKLADFLFVKLPAKTTIAPFR